MELEKLEKYKQQFDYFSQTIDSISDYLNSMSRQGSRYINAGSLANKLAIPLYDVMFVLNLAEKEHLMQKVYQVYSNNHDHLGTFRSPDKIPDNLINNSTGSKIDREDFLIDMNYEVDK